MPDQQGMISKQLLEQEAERLAGLIQQGSEQLRRMDDERNQLAMQLTQMAGAHRTLTALLNPPQNGKVHIGPPQGAPDADNPPAPGVANPAAPDPE